MKKLFGRRISLFLISSQDKEQIEAIIEKEEEYIERGYNPELKKENDNFIKQIKEVYLRI